jgi:hypothetical protein
MIKLFAFLSNYCVGDNLQSHLGKLDVFFYFSVILLRFVILYIKMLSPLYTPEI